MGGRGGLGRGGGWLSAENTYTYLLGIRNRAVGTARTLASPNGESADTVGHRAGSRLSAHHRWAAHVKDQLPFL